MTANEDVLVGVFAAVLVALIAMRMARGLRSGRLPLYRTYLDRGEDEAKFWSLLALHGISLLLIAFIAADLLLGLRFRD